MIRALVLLLFFCQVTHAQVGGAFEKALKKKLNEAVDKKLEEKNTEYEEETFNYAIAFLDKSESFENKQKGESLIKTATFLRSDEEAKSDRDKAKDIYEFGRLNYLNRRYKMAETSLKDAVTEFERLELTTDVLYLKSLGLLGQLYSDMGMFEKASEFSKKALDGWKTIYGDTCKGFAAETSNYAVLEFNLGNYSKAEREMELAVSLVGKSEGQNSMPYAIALNNKAILFLHMGRSEEALPLITKCLSIADRKLKEKSGAYLQLMTNKALIYQEKGDFVNAETTYNQAIQLQTERLKLNRASDPDYAHMLNNLASLYVLTGRLPEAEKLLKESAEIYKAKFGMKHPLTASASQDLGNVYRMQGRYADAEVLLIPALNTNKLRLGVKHPRTVQSMEDLAIIKWKKGEVEKAIQMFDSAMLFSMEFINTFFPSMSETEKTKYWEKFKPRFYTYYNFAFSHAGANPALFDKAINYRLATKGLLLSTSTKIKNLILSSGDQSLVSLYTTWTDQKRALATYYTLSQEELTEQGVNIAQLEKEANQTERLLSQKSVAFSSTLVSIDKDYKKILAKLNPGEVAVEFIQYPFFENQLTKTNRYAAVIFNKDQSPALVVYENGNDLEGKYFKAYKNLIKLKSSDEYSYKFFWAPLEPGIGAATRVYVSPDGVFNQISLNTLKATDGKYLVEKQNIRLLGNVIDLAEAKGASNASKSAFLLGFPTYGSASITALPGTEKEINAVSASLKTSGYQVAKNTGVAATETSVKEAASPRLIHVATHGYFMEDVQSARESFGVQVEYARNNPLLRSGLLMAGASEDGDGNQGFSSDDNGVLTAYEVMNLSLDKTDLVILSACETGKGDVKSGEGVYGLQRAFTVAGANQLVMSLWKVDDTATQLLMTGFYTNWITKGMEISAAFRKSQLDLMKTFPEPYYWGAFVMVE